MWKALLFITVFVCSSGVQAFCFKEAGARYREDPLLLESMARQESGLNPQAFNLNKDKHGKVLSIDYGLMQINSVHIPQLIEMGVLKSPSDLLNNPCLNVQVGAWVLAKHLQKCGVNWNCLGSYNAGFKESNEEKRVRYARKIYSFYEAALRGQ
ncbi:lytic transglycosylase [Pseudomonas protegens]|uniref:Lytic transglycosylase n=1 Tax=Pseudomonas protegens TaxID=380021 RepID=A0A2T6GBF2_9PSED|nr:lytic transglycosylase domain-containing protein [Pseudomonas protegens]PUA41484.1 lytic transglycosylase [Pseudomonas protegens]